MKMIKYICLATLIVVSMGCTDSSTKTDTSVDTETKSDSNENALPSWNDGATKSAIIDYVSDVTNPNSTNFIPVSDRIATFDNDGNLWAEQPAYFQLFFALDRIKAMAPDHPEWNEQQPYKAAIEGDMKTLASYGEHGLLEIVMTTHSGLTTTEFETIVKDWLATARHPRFNKPYNELKINDLMRI